ncbi:MAG: rhodanese-like domain-containing protein [Candidatus Cloacimonetes bacterium]|nr:rhodanese-like domain-containing protein [Candidatus Cloacimonadota bacterium]
MRPERFIVVLLLLALFCFLIARDMKEFGFSYKDVSAREAKKLMDKYPDLKIIDLSGIYEKGHIPGAINYYIGDGSFDRAVQQLDKKDRYLVYYHADRPSIEAAVKLRAAGFKKVYRLQGNYQAWVQEGFRTANSRKA